MSDFRKKLAEVSTSFKGGAGKSIITFSMHDDISTDEDKFFHVLSLKIFARDNTMGMTNAIIEIEGGLEEDDCFENVKEIGTALIEMAKIAKREFENVKASFDNKKDSSEENDLSDE